MQVQDDIYVWFVVVVDDVCCCNCTAVRDSAWCVCVSIFTIRCCVCRRSMFHVAIPLETRPWRGCIRHFCKFVMFVCIPHIQAVKGPQRCNNDRCFAVFYLRWALIYIISNLLCRAVGCQVRKNEGLLVHLVRRKFVDVARMDDGRNKTWTLHFRIRWRGRLNGLIEDCPPDTAAQGFFPISAEWRQ